MDANLHNTRFANDLMSLQDIPNGSILGINYSGMHDSAIAIVSPTGNPVFAIALERISRVKQDGRDLDELLSCVPWKKISKIAVSTPKNMSNEEPEQSELLSIRLPKKRLASTLSHGPEFEKQLKKLPCKKVYVGHQEAHAASAFWGSGFDEALCLTYDGGMSNDLWFGGLF